MVSARPAKGAANTLHLACAARHDYVPHTAAMLHSVLGMRDGLEAEIHFLHGPDLPPSYPSLLTEMVDRLGATISFRLITDDEVAGLRTRSFLPASHWYRVFLPDILALHRQTPISRHLEVETYTFDVLPEELRRVDVATAVARELAWVEGVLA